MEQMRRDLRYALQELRRPSVPASKRGLFFCASQMRGGEGEGLGSPPFLVDVHGECLLF